MRKFIPATLRVTVCALLLWGGSVANGQGTGTGTNTGTGTGGNSGLGIGTAIEDRLVDSDAEFSIDRGESVGASSSTVQGFSTVGGAGGAGAGAGGAGGGFGGAGGLGGLGGLFGGAFNQMNQSQQGSTRAVRTRLRSAIQVAPTNPQQVAARFSQRIRTNPSAARFRGTNVVVDGRTATLSGQVGSAADQRMAQLMMRLEPGVNRVDNQLNVAAPLSPSDSPSDNRPAVQPLPSGWNPITSP